MKKIILLTTAFLACGFSMNAQSSCATPQVLNIANNTTSIITVAPLSGDPTPTAISCVDPFPGFNDQNGAWFSYTPTQNVMLNINTVVTNGAPNGSVVNADPNWYYPVLEIFTGTCGNLNKSYICDDGWQGVVDISFFAKAGKTYYIVFNDLYNQIGAGTIKTFEFRIITDTNVAPTPGVATNPTPIDNAADIAIDETDSDGDGNPDNAVVFSWAPPADAGMFVNYHFLFSETPPTSIFNMQILGIVTDTTVSVTNFEPNKEYFWAIRPMNTGLGNTPDESLMTVWSFTTEQLAGIEDNQFLEIGFYPNPVGETLHLEIPLSVSLESATLHNLLGKRTQVNIDEGNTIDMSQMAAGLYILTLETNKGTMTKKVIKK